MFDLSIIILSYNTKKITLACLDHLVRSKLRNYTVELSIVDNASTDGSILAINSFIKKYQRQIQAKLIKSSKNIGFAAGNNLGIADARGKYLLLLNSDVMVQKKTLKNQLDFMNNSNHFAASTCKLLLPVIDKNGSTVSYTMDPACHRGEPTLWNSFCYFSSLEAIFPRSRLFGGYHQTWKNLSQVHSLDAISGGFFMIKKKVATKIGPLDEQFFMYAEDLDWCKRIRQAGYKLGFNPHAKAIHLKGFSGRKKTSAKNQNKLSSYHFYHTMKLYYQKHYANHYPKVVMWLVLKFIDLKQNRYIL